MQMPSMHPLTLVSVMTVAAGLVLGNPARASVFSATPDLPPASGNYVRTAGGVDCFSALGVCLIPGAPSGLTPQSSTFSASGQDIVFSTLYTFSLTDLSFLPITSFSVLGTMTQSVLGRTGAADIGSWDTEITALNLSGFIDPTNPVTVALSGAPPSTGHAEITPVSGGYDIENFFDVWATLTAGDLDPITVYLGAVHVELVAVPEPMGLSILGLPLVALGMLRRRPDYRPTAIGSAFIGS